MRYKSFILVAVLVMTALIIGCQNKIPPTVENTPNTEPYTQTFTAIQNPERVTHNTFSMVKPKEWLEISPPQYRNIIVFLPGESSLDNPFDEKIGMMVVFISDNDTRTLEELTALDLEMNKNNQPATETINVSKARFGALDGLKVTLKTVVQNRSIEAEQLRAKQGNKVYAFTIQCLEGECKHKDIFYEMAESFEWRNPE